VDCGPPVDGYGASRIVKNMGSLMQSWTTMRRVFYKFSFLAGL